MPLSLLFGFQIDWQLSLCLRITVFTIAGTVWKENPDSAVLCLSASQAWPNSHPEHITKSRGFRNRKVEIGSFLLGSQAVACLMLCLEDKSVLEQTMDGSVLGRQMDWLLLILLAPFKDLLGKFHTPLAVWQKGEKPLESSSSSPIWLLPQHLSLYLSLIPVSFCHLRSFWCYPHLTKAH